MKIGQHIEGSPEEIQNFFENNGLNLEDYIEKPDNNKLDLKWLIIPIGLFISCSVLISTKAIVNEIWVVIITLLDLGFMVWTTASIQLKFKNAWVTGFSLLGLVIMLLFSAGLITLVEATDALKNYSGE